MAALAERLEGTRRRTLALYAPLDQDAVSRAPDPIMSPPVWDLGHIGAYEELWLVRRLMGGEALHPELDAVYDAFETPRAARADVEILPEPECRRFLDAVRARTLDALDRAELADDAPPLTARGFVFDMVAVHEAQHTETVLQGLQMLPAGGYLPPRGASSDPPRPERTAPSRLRIPGGAHAIGTDGAEEFAYDCERPAHRHELAPFLIARHAVTETEWLEFVRDRGYARPALWSAAGWRWRDATAAEAPAYWSRDGEGGWTVRRFECSAPPSDARAVCHVSAHEADAFVRWAGARLPSEAEWEVAARRSRAGERPGRIDQLDFGSGLGAPGPDSACAGMIGDVWEWTSSDFDAYPGFRAFPYREYAEVFFGGGYRVLRGGSWATQPAAVSIAFRNWDLPQRRQIFSGLRLAWDDTGASA